MENFSRPPMIAPCSPLDLPIEVSEDPRQYLLRVELPGMDRQQVGVQVEGGMLRILGGHRPPSGESCVSYNPLNDTLQMRAMSALNLPEDVDPCSVVADFRGGVLLVRLPRISRGRSWWPC